jgi:hypothetical protein
MADYLSTDPSYQGITSALKKKLDEDAVARQRQIQQSIGVRGIRTSGIGLYPSQEAGQERASQDASIYSAVGGQQLGNMFTADQNEKDRQLREKLQIMQNNADSDAAAKARKSAWSAALWGIPIGLATGGASEALKGLIAKWRQPNPVDNSDGQVTIGSGW